VLGRFLGGFSVGTLGSPSLAALGSSWGYGGVLEAFWLWRRHASLGLPEVSGGFSLGRGLVACSAGTESGLGAFEYELTKYLDEFFGDGSHRRLLSEPPLTMIVAMMRHALKPTSTLAMMASANGSN
jgi:hypothetical protein